MRSSKAHFRSTKLCAAAGFGSRSLRLCVMYIQQNNLGLDRTFPSPNFVEPQTSNFGKNQVLLSGCHPCGSSSTGADQLLANSLVHREGFGWALPAWERGVHSPCGCSAITQHGRGRLDSTTVLYTLHWPQSTWCLHRVSARGSTPCCMQVRSCTASMCPMGKAFIFFFFFFPVFLAYFIDLEINLQTLSRSQLFLLRCGAYRSSIR